MDISGIRSASELLGPSATPAAEEELGKNQFLELMIAQMNNQDPLDPAKNEDFIAQLAQFSTVEGIANMNTSMGEMAAALQSSMTLEAASLVGRSVLVGTGLATLDGGGVTGSIDVGEASSNVAVEISTAEGALVKSIDLGPQAAGPLRFAWDGSNQSGAALPTGSYRINAFSEVAGVRREFTVSLPEQVVSVSIGEGGIVANLASGASVPATQIKEIQ